MKNVSICLIALSLCGFLSFAKAQNQNLIFSDGTPKIVLVEQVGDPSKPLKGRVNEQATKLQTKILDQLHHSHHLEMIRINQCARNLMGNTEGPNVLYLSGQEGGFPRQGLEITEGSLKGTYPNLHFVDLVIDERRFEQGALSIYTHELGHVMMNNILTSYWERFPQPTSPKQHVSMGITDPLTAFYEGWGVHFQRLTMTEMPIYQKSFNAMYSINRATTAAWHSNLDEELRVNWVLENKYIYDKLLPQGADFENMTIQQKILLEHTSAIADLSRLKTAQQMLSSEGVIATLFYHINTNPKIQKRYQKEQFYQNFLVKSWPDQLKPEEFFTPIENIYLKNLWVWKHMQDIENPQHPFLDYIRTWCTLFPEDQKDILATFIMITKGKTIDSSLASLTEEINLVGQIGDITSFRSKSKEFTTKYKELVEAVNGDLSLLDKNMGPQIWIGHPDLKIQRTLWMAKPLAPLQVNINTATSSELHAFFTPDEVKMILDFRNNNGFIANPEDLPELTEKIKPLLL